MVKCYKLVWLLLDANASVAKTHTHTSTQYLHVLHLSTLYIFCIIIYLSISKCYFLFNLCVSMKVACSRCEYLPILSSSVRPSISPFILFCVVVVDEAFFTHLGGRRQAVLENTKAARASSLFRWSWSPSVSTTSFKWNCYAGCVGGEAAAMATVCVASDWK